MQSDKKKLKKTFRTSAIILSAIITIIIIYKLVSAFIFIFAFDDYAKDVWNINNRILMGEFYSPDSTTKLGYYHYDEGALGYTITCVSLIAKTKEYPLNGNIVQINSIPEVIWEANNSLHLKIDTSGLFGPFPDSLRLNGVRIQIKKTGKPIVNKFD